MNRWWYEWIITRKFPQWFRQALGPNQRPFLVQDHEKCLWNDLPLAALRQIGVELLTNFPKCSPDFNAIEGCWREVRARLAATEPTRFESRAQFVARLRVAVAWVNRNRTDLFLQWCTDQKERARECVDVRNGGRTGY